MSIRGTSDNRHYCLRLKHGLNLLVLFGVTGCRIPLLVYPAPEAGSGMRLQLRDDQGVPIQEDGLMIVHRSYPNIPILTGMRAPSRTEIVPVRDGVAQLPHKWAVASVYIWWFYYLPLIDVFPGGNLIVLPLVPGSFVARNSGYPIDCIRYYNDIRNGTLLVSRSEDDPQSARYYFESCVLRKLKRKSEVPEPGDWELSLPDEEYAMVREFIDAQLHALKETYGDLTPSTQPAENTEPPGIHIMGRYLVRKRVKVPPKDGCPLSCPSDREPVSP